MSLVAGMPVLGKAAKLDEPDLRLGALDTNGARIFGISPDGSVLAGMTDNTVLTFLDAESLSIISESESIPELELMEEATVSWSPNSRTIAFGFNWQFGPNLPLWIADVETGHVETITSLDPRDAATPQSREDGTIDRLFTAWLDNDTVLVSQLTSPTIDEPDHAIWAINTVTGDSEEYADLGEQAISLIASRMWRLNGGEIVFAARIQNGDGPLHNGAVLLSPDGKVTERRPGELSTAMIVDVNDTHMITNDLVTIETSYIPLDPGEEPALLWEQFTKPDGWEEAMLPILGPYPDTMFSVLMNDRETLSAHLFVGKQEHQLHQLTGEFRSTMFHWADGKILIAGAGDSWLIDVPLQLHPDLAERAS